MHVWDKVTELTEVQSKIQEFYPDNLLAKTSDANFMLLKKSSENL